MKSVVETPTGYLHPGYAASLAQFGTPRALPRCGGWVLERAIPSSPGRDAMSCYPLFACRDWSQLAADLDDLAGDLVCLSVVTDPLGDYDEALLAKCFPDRVVPFKEHFGVDLQRPPEDYVHRHHRRNAQKALALLHVERCQTQTRLVEDWTRLYRCLIRRHGITGIQAFSATAFARQFEVPGLVVFRALHQGVSVGMILLYVQGRAAYYHLGAHSPRGYELGSSFALFWRAIESLRQEGLQWLNLGAGAGLDRRATDGLSRFKRGWSTGTRTAYFCGRIFDRAAYDRLAARTRRVDTAYFPAYREGEFH